MSLIDNLLSLFQPKAQASQKIQAPVPDQQIVGNPNYQPQPQPNPLSDLEDQIRTGFSRFSNPPPPVATQSAQLAQAAQGLPDPLMAAVITLIEHGGQFPSNPKRLNNIGSLGGDVSYPTPEVAILGGGERNQLGLKGVLQSPAYQKYRESGNLEDFFNVYTPPGEEYGNPSMEELISRYNQLRSLFTQ